MQYIFNCSFKGKSVEAVELLISEGIDYTTMAELSQIVIRALTSSEVRTYTNDFRIKTVQ